jgi:general secretion pathway protein K
MSERGAALLAALGGLALIGALAASALPLATGPLRRAEAAVAQAEARAAAEGALHRLAAALADASGPGPLRLDGSVVETRFLDAEVIFAAQEIGGLIDLDAAPQAVLERLLAAAGAPPAQAARVAAALAEARRGARGRRAFAAEEAAFAAIAAEDAPTLAAALDYATVWSERPTVDPWTAPAPALAAAAGATLAEAQAFVAARLLAGRAATLPEGWDRAALAEGDGRVVRLRVTAAAGEGRATVEAVVALTPAPAPRARILRWR